MKTDLNKYIELQALITEREGMIAENTYRFFCGKQVAYDEDNFAQLADAMRELIEETK